MRGPGGFEGSVHPGGVAREEGVGRELRGRGLNGVRQTVNLKWIESMKVKHNYVCET